MVLNHANVRGFARAEAATGTDEAPGATAARRAEAVDRFRLTPRELHVLELLAIGLTATAIGHACRISPRTVGKHLENIYAKLGCHDRLMAVRRAIELGLVGSQAQDTATDRGLGA
jgi:DNA-binding NarL/FixJ family response regulator